MAVGAGPATIRATCVVRGPDGKIKGTFDVHGTTELSETELREALNIKEGSKDGSDSYQRRA